MSALLERELQFLDLFSKETGTITTYGELFNVLSPPLYRVASHYFQTETRTSLFLQDVFEEIKTNWDVFGNASAEFFQRYMRTVLTFTFLKHFQLMAEEELSNVK